MVFTPLSKKDLEKAMNSLRFNPKISLKIFGEPNTWNVSNITDMSGLFGGLTSFNQNIGNWDVGNVTNMHQMFIVASTFNQDCLLYTSPSPRDRTRSRMPSSA